MQSLDHGTMGNKNSIALQFGTIETTYFTDSWIQIQIEEHRRGQGSSHNAFAHVVSKAGHCQLPVESALNLLSLLLLLLH